MVKQLTNRDATCLADPVILHNKDMWRELYKKNANTLNQGNKYILYFFLDHPSVLAIDSTMQLAQQTGYHVVSFRLHAKKHRESYRWWTMGVSFL